MGHTCSFALSGGTRTGCTVGGQVIVERFAAFYIRSGVEGSLPLRSLVPSLCCDTAMPFCAKGLVSLTVYSDRGRLPGVASLCCKASCPGGGGVSVGQQNTQ